MGAPFTTPASPWPLPPLTMGTLLFDTTRLNRATARWAAPTGNFTSLVNTWSSGSIADANTGFGHALKYLMTGNATEATNAFTVGTGETFANETDAPRLWSQSLPFVYAWCKGALSGANQTTLINSIESNNATLETAITSTYLLDGPGNNGNGGMPGYIFGIIAINGQSGATDRRTNLRNLVQNMTNHLLEANGDGWWYSYAFLAQYLISCIIAYHIATGETNLLTTRCPFLNSRGEVMARALSADGRYYYRIGACNQASGVDGKVSLHAWPDDPWAHAMMSDMSRDPLSKWVCDQINANSPTIWNQRAQNLDPTWMALGFYDSTLTGVSPQSGAVPLSKIWPISGFSEMRGGWSQSTDLVINAFAGPDMQNDHCVRRDGSFTIRVGNSYLIKDGYGYPGRPSNWENAEPIATTEVGGFTMRSSGISFSPTTVVIDEDRDGGAAIVDVNSTASHTAYPLSNTLTSGVRSTWKGGTINSLYDDGRLAKVLMDIGFPFPQITSGTCLFGLVRNGSTKGTLVISDNFVAPATIGNIRRNFWSSVKPTYSSETIIRGTTNAGILSTTQDHVVIVVGTMQVTIQMCSPFSIIQVIGCNTSNASGGTFESFFGSYAATGGGNLDYLANVQQPPDTTQDNFIWPWIENNWRTSFLTTQALAGGRMTFALTIDAQGTTAPSYTETQALALLTPASSGASLYQSSWWDGLS